MKMKWIAIAAVVVIAVIIGVIFASRGGEEKNTVAIVTQQPTPTLKTTAPAPTPTPVIDFKKPSQIPIKISVEELIAGAIANKYYTWNKFEVSVRYEGLRGHFIDTSRPGLPIYYFCFGPQTNGYYIIGEVAISFISDSEFDDLVKEQWVTLRGYYHSYGFLYESNPIQGIELQNAELVH